MLIIDDDHSDIDMDELLSKEAIVDGIKLPTNDISWESANTYFRNNIAYNEPIAEVNECISKLQSCDIYYPLTVVYYHEERSPEG